MSVMLTQYILTYAINTQNKNKMALTVTNIAWYIKIT